MGKIEYTVTLGSEDMLLLLMLLADRVDLCEENAHKMVGTPAAAKYWTKQGSGARHLRERMLEVRPVSV